MGFLGKIIGFLISHFSGKVLDRLACKVMSNRLCSEVKKWAKKLPKGARLDSDSIFINPFDPVQSEDDMSIAELKQHIYDAKLPSQLLWLNALIERFNYIRENVPEPQGFYSLSQSEAEKYLSKLSQKLYNVSLEDERIYKNNLIGRVYGNTFISHGALEKHLFRFNTKQIEKHKKSAKYIPEIFVDNYKAKEICRFFVAPSIFWKKLLWNVQRLNFSFLNTFLEKTGLGLFSITLPKELSEELALHALEDKCNQLETILTNKIDYLENIKDTKWESLGDIITPDNIRSARKYWPLVQNAVYANEHNLSKIQQHINALKSKVILITSRAGRGKTNFVCDLMENVIFKRKIPAIFFSAKNFEYDLDNITNYFLRTSLPISLVQPADGFDALKQHCKNKGHPFTIIIDGLNEVSDIAKFSLKLQEFISEILTYDFIKIILTCRSEYIAYRFDNLKVEFGDVLISIENLEMREHDKEILLEKYKHFFNLSAQFYGNAYYVLTANPLVLRLYCETYGDSHANTAIDIGPIDHIYKVELFKKYLDKKMESIVQIDRQGTGLPVGHKSQYFQALNSIVEYMVNNQSYGNISIGNLNTVHHDSIDRLIQEDMILRKDVVKNSVSANTYSEVINFTFDEFRDYLIASYLLDKVWLNDRNKFTDFTNSFIHADEHGVNGKTRTIYRPNIIAEGVGRFIIQIAKQNGIEEIETRFKTHMWYENVRLESIFAINDQYISDDDIGYVKQCFLANIDNSSEIIWYLFHRRNINQFCKLNIQALFDILRQLNAEQYFELVNPVFQNYSPSSAMHFRWKIDKLANRFNEILTRIDSSEDERVCLFEFLIFLFDITSRNYHSPALDVYDEFMDKFPDKAIKQLTANSQSNNLNIALHVLRKLTCLKEKECNIPKLKEIACQIVDRLMKLSKDEYNGKSFVLHITVFSKLRELDEKMFTEAQKAFINKKMSNIPRLEI